MSPSKIILVVLWMAFPVRVRGETQNGSLSRPSSVNVGALVAFNSILGKATRAAIEAAVEDVNNSTAVLPGTKLNLFAADTNCSEFVGLIEAMKLMSKGMVAIIGPTSSSEAHVLSALSSELHVPLLAVSATDPSLRSPQFPFLLQPFGDDALQMSVVADFVAVNGWRDVAVVFPDDDYGRGGAAALAAALSLRRRRLAFLAPLPPATSPSAALLKLALQPTRVVVVHVSPDSGLAFFSAARELGLLRAGYVWIATDWLAAALDDAGTTDDVQGVVTLRRRVDSMPMQGKNNPAYGAVWTVARAVDACVDQGLEMSFEGDPTVGKGLRVFRGGKGLMGFMQAESERGRLRGEYEVMNVVGGGMRAVGSWTNGSGIGELKGIVWPGEIVERPRGWEFAGGGEEGKGLRIGVPRRVSFREFVSGGEEEGKQQVEGFAVDVFKAAVERLPYRVEYAFELFGDGVDNPRYDDIVNGVANDVYDAAVGDIAITTRRTKMVDFTQPYAESGLVVVAPVRRLNSNAWSFLKPFSTQMWCVTAALFLFIGTVVWILEHRFNSEFRGPPRQQLVTICWFSFSTMFFAHRQNTVSTLGRLVLIIWLFVVLIINSSYTASLTSILTVQQLSSGVKGLESLISSDDPIGYQIGSFANNYMISEFNIAPSRLVALGSPEEYAKALRLGPHSGGVAAIVDEKPYVDIFLAKYCEFKTVGQEFTKSGWGFAFPRDSPLALDLSTAILSLSETGDLQRIHDMWISSASCPDPADDVVEANRLKLESFWGLFLICGVACTLALLVFFFKVLTQYRRFEEDLDSSSSEAGGLSGRLEAGQSSCAGNIGRLMNFADKKHEEIRSIRMQRSMERSQRLGSSHHFTDGDASAKGPA
ncbi:glutamate receptor 3.4-like [Wolffia australiana]